MSKISEKMYEALTLKYRSEMAEAEATLLIYFNNSVGIGEHPQHLEEMDKMVEKMTNAKDKLETLVVTEDMLKIINEQKGEDNGN
jgi:predicted signal transduction protein with EAL and GGDEF domain